MAKASALAYLWTTLTQGSADAFIQNSVATALSGQTKSAYRIRELLFEFGVAGATQGGFLGGEYELCLTRKSMSAMPVITDKSVITKLKYVNSFTTSGAARIPQVIREVFTEEDNLIIVEDPIYAQLDTAATTGANVCMIRIGYEVVTMSEVDRLQLIANSLA